MITKKKIEIYNFYDKNTNAFDRLGTKSDHDILNYHDWILIDNFIQDLYLINKGLTASSFNEAINKLLKQKCDNDETIQLLRDIAKKSREK